MNDSMNLQEFEEIRKRIKARKQLIPCEFSFEIWRSIDDIEGQNSLGVLLAENENAELFLTAHGGIHRFTTEEGESEDNHETLIWSRIVGADLLLIIGAILGRNYDHMDGGLQPFTVRSEEDLSVLEDALFLQKGFTSCELIRT